MLESVSYAATVGAMILSIMALYNSHKHSVKANQLTENGNNLTREGNMLTAEGNVLAVAMDFPFLHVEDASIEEELFEDIMDGSMLDINDILSDHGFNEIVKVLSLKIKNTGNMGISAMKCRRVAVFSGNDNYIYHEIAEGDLFEETEKENRFFNIQILNEDSEMKTVNILAKKKDVCLTDYIQKLVKRSEYITIELELDTVAVNHLRYKNYLVFGLERGGDQDLKVKYSEFRCKGSGFRK